MMNGKMINDYAPAKNVQQISNVRNCRISNACVN